MPLSGCLALQHSVLVCIAVQWDMCDSACVGNVKSLTAVDGVFSCVAVVGDGWRPMAAECSCHRS